MKSGIVFAVVFSFVLCAAASEKAKVERSGYNWNLFPKESYTLKRAQTWLRGHLQEDLANMPPGRELPDKYGHTLSVVISTLHEQEMALAIDYYKMLRNRASIKHAMEQLAKFKEEKGEEKSGATKSTNANLANEMLRHLSGLDSEIVALNSEMNSPKTKILANIIYGTLPGWSAKNFASEDAASSANPGQNPQIPSQVVVEKDRILLPPTVIIDERGHMHWRKMNRGAPNPGTQNMRRMEPPPRAKTSPPPAQNPNNNRKR